MNMQVKCSSCFDEPINQTFFLDKNEMPGFLDSKTDIITLIIVK